MNRISIFGVLLALAFFIHHLPSIADDKRLGRAQKFFEVGEYFRAINALNRAYRREDNRFYRGQISFYQGESFKEINQPRRAAASFGRSIRFEYPERRAMLYQAQQLMKLGEYEEALKLFETFLAQVPGDPLATSGRAGAIMALNPPAPTRHAVTQLRRLNSRHNDFSPVIAGYDPDLLYFTSMRQAGRNRRQLNRITGQGASQIFSARIDAHGEWHDINPLFDPVPGALWEDGTFSITSDGRDAYFTRCRQDNSGPMGAEIWNIKRLGGRWGEAAEIELGPDSIAFAHPSISHDGNTLYFVSDLPGGYGMLDIWRVTKGSDDSWGIPENLGSLVNSAGDEKFPLIRENGILYFSSDGHPGFGGLDLFQARELENGGWQVSNMGQPMNSMADDFGITFFPGREAGFFSSSRGNARGEDNIFSFVLPVIQAVVTGNVKLSDNAPIPYNTSVRIVGTDGSDNRVTVTPAGVFSALLAPGYEYVLLFSAPGYFNHRERVSTTGLTESRQFNLDVQLGSSSRPVEMGVIDLGANEQALPQSALTKLDEMASKLAANPALNLIILSHVDNRGEAGARVTLSEQRVQLVINYLVGKGIAQERISGRGFGGEQPRIVNATVASAHNYLREGDVLNDALINRLDQRVRETVRLLNNRVEYSLVY